MPLSALKRPMFETIPAALLFVLLIFHSAALPARNSGKAHPFRKFDNTPNPNDADIWTFTLESNTYRDTGYFSPVADFSSRDGWDLQVASYNIPYYGGGADNYEWDTYLNLSKSFTIAPRLTALIGTQNGTTLLTRSRQLHHVDYGLIIYQPVEAANVHAGPYWANKSITATTDSVGYTVGFGLDLLPRRLAIQGDYFSGRNNLSGAVFNLLYRLLPNVQLYMGVGVPETHSGNEFYGIAGFNLFTRDSKEDVEPSTVVQ